MSTPAPRGGLKPLSSGFASFEIDVQAPDWQAVDRARQALAHWRCGETLAAGVLTFARTYDGKRPLQAFVANAPRVGPSWPSAFVWAVAKGQDDTEAARRIEAAAAPVLAEYRRRRATCLAQGGRGMLALVRDWFCDAKGACDPLQASR